MGYSIYEWFDDNFYKFLSSLNEKIESKKDDEYIEKYDIFIEEFKKFNYSQSSHSYRYDQFKKALISILFDEETQLHKIIEKLSNIMDEEVDLKEIKYNSGKDEIVVNYNRNLEEYV